MKAKHILLSFGPSLFYCPHHERKHCRLSYRWIGQNNSTCAAIGNIRKSRNSMMFPAFAVKHCGDCLVLYLRMNAVCEYCLIRIFTIVILSSKKQRNSSLGPDRKQMLKFWSFSFLWHTKHILSHSEGSKNCIFYALFVVVKMRADLLQMIIWRAAAVKGGIGDSSSWMKFALFLRKSILEYI